MRRSQRQIGVILGLVLLLAAGFVLLAQAARAQLPQSTAAQAPAAQAGMVPTFKLDPAQAVSADQRGATITPIEVQEHTLDMTQLGLRPLDRPLPLSNGQPAGSAIGITNAIMVASPDVVSSSTANAIGTLLANFTPAENVEYYVNGVLVTTFTADANGRVAIGINTGAGLGYITMEGIGGISGKRAGAVAQVLDNAPPVPGFAAAPHAVNQTITGTFYAYGFRFLASSVVTLTRNGVSLGTAATNANGRFFVTITPANGADASAVYAAVTTTVGSMSGSSVEERADAGVPPLGDQNLARGFVDRPVVPSSTGGTVSMVAEGFQPGETITLSGCAAGTVPADANGAAGLFLTAPAGASVYNCVATGGTSGRVARGSLQAAPNAVNAPSGINQPSGLPLSATNFVFLFNRLLPSQSGTVFVDGVSRGPASTNATGYGSIVLTTPLTAGIHSVAFVGASGQVAIAPLFVRPAPVGNTPTPTVASGTVTATTTPCAVNYTYITSTATIVTGTVDTGNHCDDCGTNITLPFPVRFYGVNYTSANLVSNGSLQFVSNNAAFTNACLPTATMNQLVSPLWDDLHTGANPGCAGYPGGLCGIFTDVTGTVGSRIFTVEWRAVYFAATGTAVNFAIRFYENSPINRIDFYYGTGVGTSTATIGLQRDTGSLFVQYSCDTPAPTTGLQIIWQQPCGTPLPTNTPSIPTPTRTVTPAPTNTGQPATNTPVPPTVTAPAVTATNTAVAATATATPCTISFTDVDVNNPFYSFIRCLACRQIVSGYSDGTFRWGNNVTRGQLSKIISGAAGQNNAIPSSQQTFEDVPNSNVFWVFIERLAGVGAIPGYNCGGSGEPCVPPGNRPYFRWGANATRGQISKITAVTAGWNGPIPTTQQTFEDVPSTNPFWTWIEELASRNVISGYTCGGPGEPCVPPGNRAYFRWGANATRGQMSKIAAESFFPGCVTPADAPVR